MNSVARTSLVVILLAALCGCRLSILGGRSHLEQAEAFARDGDTERAIAEYQLHMQYRLGVPKRPDWENPYLYLLTIGDLQLEKGRVDDALASYEEAERRSVDPKLIADRFRNVASHYEHDDKIDQALEILKKYRERDPLLFDGMADRIGKEQTEREDEKRGLVP